ncbi:MAG: hypothetical protein K2P62_00960 [Phocaeicola sp.]|nr:hypothetical protein [Phocaeicola sp.]
MGIKEYYLACWETTAKGMNRLIIYMAMERFEIASGAQSEIEFRLKRMYDDQSHFSK